MQMLLIMLIVVLLAFSVLLLALAKQSPREKQTEDKEQEEYIRDYAETVRQTGGSMKKLEHWKVIAIYLIIYDMIAVNFSYFMALLVRFDFRYSSIPTDYFDAWRSFAPIYTIIILAVFGCLHLYNSVWRFASFHELIKITVATVITGVLHIVGITIFWGRMPASYYLIGIMLQFFLTVGVRFSYRFVLLERNRREKSEREERSKNVMIIGAGEAGRTIVRELQNAKETNSRVRCLIDDNPNKWGRYMEGVPVVGGRDDIFLNVDKYHINQILLAIPTATPHQKRDILNICKETGCELKQLPGVYQLVNGEVSLSKMKKVAVEDLLGRDTIKVNMLHGTSMKNWDITIEYHNWELIIVDDCSTDNTDIVVGKIKDPRIRYIKNEKNSGAAVSRNRALREANGRWVAFLDSDDLWKPEKLEKQICFMMKNRYYFSYTNYEEIDADGNKTNVIVTGPKVISKTGMFNYCWPG